MLTQMYRADSDVRRKQIDTLKIFNANVVEVKDGSEYQVHFQTGGKDFILHVSLSNEFPNDKPKLRITPLVFHHWLNSDGEVSNAPGLLNFSTAHSDLGRVVQVIISEFVRTPPPLAPDGSSSNPSPSVPIRSDNNDIGRISPSYYHQNFSPPVHNATHYQPVAFPELGGMSMDELQFLNECVERQDEFIDNLPHVKEVDKNLDDLITQIEELAESNLSKRSQLEELQQDIYSRLEEVTKLVFETETLNHKYQHLSDKYSPKNIKNQLLLAAESADNECDRISKMFLDGSMDVDKFLLEFLQKRTLERMRKTKEEKLTQQLKNLERAGH